jgi:hypothetical protein
MNSPYGEQETDDPKTDVNEYGENHRCLDEGKRRPAQGTSARGQQPGRSDDQRFGYPSCSRSVCRQARTSLATQEHLSRARRRNCQWHGLGHEEIAARPAKASRMSLVVNAPRGSTAAPNHPGQPARCLTLSSPQEPCSAIAQLRSRCVAARKSRY